MVMEKMYIKKANGRYEFVGYRNVNLTEGIWLVQEGSSHKSFTSLVYKVGDLKRPVDVVTHAAITSMSDEVAQYVSKLCDTGSEEYKEAKQMLGGYLNDVSFSGISPYDISSLILRKISMLVEESNQLAQDLQNQ